jgi:BppU N-terminal domain
MYSTQAYIYQQITQVLLMDTGAGETFIYRYDPVYAKQLTINKGVDNVLLFEFINQQEKPVNITGSTFVFRVINTESDEILIQEPMVILNAPTGRAKVTLTSSQLLEVLAQPANYSIQRTQPGGLTEAVFTNAQAGAKAPVNIVDSVLPQHVPSAPLTIPTTKLSAQLSYDGTTWSQYPANPYWAGNPNGGTYYNSFLNTEFFSSFIEPQNSVTTVQMTLDGYTGTIKAQAAENYQSIWYNVTESTTYLNKTGTIYMNIVGWHPLLRIAFNNSIFAVPDQPGTPAIAQATVVDGIVTGITVLNGGTGYLAPPKINIIGSGAGATAEATVSGGVVTGITVTNGGSGYWYLPNAGYNAGEYPINQNQLGAAVIISTGYAVDLLYR